MAVNPPPGQDTFERAIAFYDAHRFDEASALCIGLLAVQQQHVGAKNLMGAIAMARGDFRLAADLFGETVKLAPDAADLHVNHGDALQALDNVAGALKSYDAALKRAPTNAAAHFKRGLALQRLGKPAGAETAFTQAVTLSPAFAEAWQARGVLRFDQDRFADALADHDRALQLQPDVTNIIAARARALEALDRRAEALTALEKALALEPDFYAAQDQLFNLHLRETQLSPALDMAAQALSAANARQDADHLRSDRATYEFRLLHDLEQTTYLLQRGIEAPGLRKAHAALAAAYARLGRVPRAQFFNLTDTEIAAIAAFRETVIRNPPPALASGALNPDKDWAAVEQAYFTSTPEVVVIDDFLSAEALTQLRDFALTSTIWRRAYKNQYLGAFSQNGFVGPLHMQIAEELQQKMPRIFAPHRLHQLWGFKYASTNGSKGIGVHADFARVNLNFWVTPDAANLDPQSGGMVVYNVPAPKSWQFQEYNLDTSRIYAFLKERRATAQTVPYRCNRAVLFNSTLFHETDNIRFKEGYENRRINVTYLFGRGLKT